jgi:hypothetical protein
VSKSEKLIYSSTRMRAGGKVLGAGHFRLDVYLEGRTAEQTGSPLLFEAETLAFNVEG